MIEDTGIAFCRTDCDPAQAMDATDAFGQCRPLTRRRERAAAWLSDALRRMRTLATYGPNWDSYGASAVNAISIFHANQVAYALAWVVGVESPSITATPEGNIGFSWDYGDRSVDLEVTPAGKLLYSAISDAGGSEGTADLERIVEILTGW